MLIDHVFGIFHRVFIIKEQQILMNSIVLFNITRFFNITSCFNTTALFIKTTGNKTTYWLFVMMFMYGITFPLSAKDSSFPSNHQVLLITSQELVTAWQPFADWKTLHGKPTKIISVQHIEKTYQAKHIQEKIRLCIRDHIDNHDIRWVILGGDSLPGGKGLVPGGHTTVHKEEPQGIPTDIVYLSPTNWDADNDGIYGEFYDDRKAITYPDGHVGLGRIPVRTPEDIAAFTEKVIAYESNYPSTGFAKRMVYTNTESHAAPKVHNSWNNYLSKVWDGNAKRFFFNKTAWDTFGQPGSYPLSPANMVKLFNDKSTGKLHIHGHGHLPVWILENNTHFSSAHVKQLNNEHAYPLITTVSCNTGEYDSEHDPSIVEHILRHPKGGSVAVVAPVRTGKPHFSNPNDYRLMISEGKLDGTTMTMTQYWAIGMQEQVTTGEALMKAKAQMIKDGETAHQYHLCLCEINLLGDPTLDMRSDNPRYPKLSIPQTIKTGQQNIQVISDAPGSTITLWKKNELYKTIIADKKGEVQILIHPKTQGNLLVSVSGVNLNSVIQQINVVSHKP